MFRKILGTFLSKFLAAVFNFLIVIVTTQFLGTEGKGITALIMANVTLVVLFNDILGGPSLVYLVPRQKLLQLLVPSYLWAIINSVIISSILAYFAFIPAEYNLHIFFLSLLHCLLSINLTIFVGQEKIKLHNYIFIAKVGINLLVLLLIFVVFNTVNVSGFIYSIYAATGLMFLVSEIFILKNMTFEALKDFGKTLKEMLRYGFLVQLGNVLQFFNYRFSYYLLEKFSTTEKVGIYSVAVNFVEALMLIGRSISMIQYSRISNIDDIHYSRKITIQLAGISIVSIFIGMIPLILIPPAVYEFIFGAGFGAARRVIWVLAPGILVLGGNTVLSHYFAGTGRFNVNTTASGIGFVATVVFGLLLIPPYEMIGAGLTASISFLIIFIYTFYIFKKETGIRWLQILPGKEDLRLLKKELNILLNR